MQVFDRDSDLLTKAVADGDGNTMRLILEARPDLVSKSDSQYQTPLSVAVRQDKFELAQLLLQRGADPNDYHTQAALEKSRNAEMELLILGAAGKPTEHARLRKKLREAFWADDVENVGAIIRSDVSLVAEKDKYLESAGADDNYLLCLAVREKPHMLQVFVEQGVSFRFESDMPYKWRSDLLRSAAAGAGPDSVRILLAAGARNLLHAAAVGTPDWVQMVLAAGADPNLGNDSGSTALSIAAFCGSLEATRLLLAARADPNLCNKEGNTPLHGAARENFLDIVRNLLAAGADPNLCNKEGNTPLHEAARENFPDMVQILLAAGANPDLGNKEGNTPLHEAARKNFLDIVRNLLAKGADPNLCNKEGNTPLHGAAGENFPNMVQILLAAGANPNLGNNTPLHEAAGGNFPNMVQILLAAGANVNVTNNEGSTPLHGAARGESVEIVQTLLAASADPNVRDKRGDTALHNAASSCRLEAARILMAAGANANVGNNDGSTPLHFATGSAELVRILLDAGCSAILTNANGDTALHYAARRNSLDVMKLLFLAGGDLRLRNKDNRSAFDLCNLHCKMEFAGILPVLIELEKYPGPWSFTDPSEPYYIRLRPEYLDRKSVKQVGSGTVKPPRVVQAPPLAILVYRDGRELGPYTVASFRQGIASGQFRLTDPARGVSESNWTTVGEMNKRCSRNAR